MIKNILTLCLFVLNIGNLFSSQTNYYDMILVEAGTFQMGDNDALIYRARPVHSVTITKDYYIGKYEVTQGLWQEIMGVNPSEFAIDNEKPVENVTWYDCIEFCNRLSEYKCLEKYYNIDSTTIDVNNLHPDDTIKWVVTINENANGYRLPTESEWEFAAKGGNLSQSYKYSGSNDVNEVAWWGNLVSPQGTATEATTYKIGLKAPNELGIYDMSGNVSEWCWDWDGNYTNSSKTDPIGSTSGYGRIARGSGWDIEAKYCHTAYRSNAPNYKPQNKLGLRLVSSIDNLEDNCEINNISINTTNIDCNTRTYSINGEVEFNNAPNCGKLIITEIQSGKTAEFLAPFLSPTVYQIDSLQTDQGYREVQAEFIR